MAQGYLKVQRANLYEFAQPKCHPQVASIRNIIKYPWCFYFVQFIYVLLLSLIGWCSCWHRNISGPKVNNSFQIAIFYEFVWPICNRVFTTWCDIKCCCSHFWKIHFGPCWCKDILRVKGQAKITNCYFLSWRNQYALIEHCGIYLSAIISTHGVYQSDIAYICEEINLGTCWRKGILRVKGQALITNRNFYEF